MADKFKSYSSDLDSPGLEHYDITPSDTVDEEFAFRSIWVGEGGHVVLVSLSGRSKTYRNCASGSVIPMRGRRVNNTGTTASYMLGIY